jgi:hypothetical protein
MQHDTTDLRVVPLDSGVYEVHLDTGAGSRRIGKVSTSNARESWTWQHRDGERSSPVTASLGDVVHALANYHRTFKAQPKSEPIRRLLFG